MHQSDFFRIPSSSSFIPSGSHLNDIPPAAVPAPRFEHGTILSPVTSRSLHRLNSDVKTLLRNTESLFRSKRSSSASPSRKSKSKSKTKSKGKGKSKSKAKGKGKGKGKGKAKGKSRQ